MKILKSISAWVQFLICIHFPAYLHHDPVLIRPSTVASNISDGVARENGLDYNLYANNSKFSLGNGYTVRGKSYKPKIDIDYYEIGMASWYANKFHGRDTTSGAKYDNMLYTAAHRTLPLPSVVKVVRVDNKKSVLVVVNDRGPFKGGSNRIIDLSRRAAQDLGILHKGTTKVRVEYMHEETKALLSRMSDGERRKALAAYQQALTHQVAESDSF